MRRPSDHDGLGTCWLIGGLLVAACCFWNAFPHAGLSGTTSSDSTISRVSSDHTTIPIEHIRVGDRVVTELPKEARDADRSQSLADRQTVDPHTWRLVRMRAETVWDDGTIDDINVETLQPPVWIESHQAEVGNSVPIPLDLVEMGLPDGLMAKVFAIERCPPIEQGAGRVVLTTVNHLNNYVFDLTIEDESGHAETIGVTGFHKFFSQTSKAWVSAGQLESGESLNVLEGEVRVVDLRRRMDSERVYNMTIEGEHVYRVSDLAVLVHNTCWEGEVVPGVGVLKGPKVSFDEAVDQTSQGLDIITDSKTEGWLVASNAGAGAPVFEQHDLPHYHATTGDGSRIGGHTIVVTDARYRMEMMIPNNPTN